VTITESNYNSDSDPNSLWEVRLDANQKRADEWGNFISPLTYGAPPWDAPGTETYYVNVDVIIPEGTEDGQHTIEIYSCPWEYQSASYGYWYVFTINVVSDPVVLVENLIAKVKNLNLQYGIENSLDAKLDAAYKALDDLNDNNDQAAVNALESFINEVQAQSGDKIPTEVAEELIADAQAIINLIQTE